MGGATVDWITAARGLALETAGRAKVETWDLRTLATPAAAVAGHVRMPPLQAPALAPAPIPLARRTTHFARLARRMTHFARLARRMTHFARLARRMTCPGPVTRTPHVMRVTQARMEDPRRPRMPMTRT